MYRLYYLIRPLMARYRWLRIVLHWLIAKFPLLLIPLQRNQRAHYAELKSSRERNVILVDVTHLARTGLHTGIQRVVRSIYNELKELAPNGIDVEPVCLMAEGGFWHFRYYDLDLGVQGAEVVVPRQGDIFLGVDLNASVIHASKVGLFDDWRKRGAKNLFVVHDILPITHPHWWEGGTSHRHEEWLRAILGSADVVVSVSKSTQNEVIRWAQQASVDTSNVRFDWFHLGANFDSSANESEAKTVKASDVDQSVVKLLHEKETFLVVGTLEPRKGHMQCLKAFELLWEKESDVHLVFVGCEGWLVNKLIKKINSHPELGNRLFWLDGISDEYLTELYRASTCLVQPSNGEGFGLSVIEGAYYGLPIILRDIPIFRELADNHAAFFKGDAPFELAAAVESWLCVYRKQQHASSSDLEWNTWRDSALQLNNILKEVTSVREQEDV
jgi:glycosyltransferase involved in cell wall biosynthesis